MKKSSTDVELPVRRQNDPYEVELEGDATYRWCHCGLSDEQPFCDDSHVGTGFEPIEFTAPISASYHLCGCKRSDNKPFCFGNCRGLSSKHANRSCTEDW